MGKLLKMPKRGLTTEGEVLPVSSGRPEYIIQYPRLQRGDHYADFTRDKRVHPEVYHCVVQREGSNEIQSWTQHPSLEIAMKQAEGILALMVGSSLERDSQKKRRDPSGRVRS